MIDQLPTASRLRAAVMLDKESAAEFAREEGEQGEQGPPEPYTPPLAEWGPMHELMAAVFDRLGDVANSALASVQVPSGKARPKYSGRTYARPRTAIEEAREALALDVGHQVLDMLFPGLT